MKGGEFEAAFGRLSVGDGGHVDDADVMISFGGGGEDGKEEFYK